MKKNSFTVAEMMIALCMIAVICAIVLPAMRYYTPDYQKAMFRKAYAITEDVISKMINDDRFYPVEDMGFAYVTGVDLDGKCFGGVTESSGGCGNSTPDTKFRDVFRFYLDETEDIEECNNCFRTNDDITWQIPNHDFSAGDITVAFYVREKDVNKEKEKFEFIINKKGRITLPQCGEDPEAKRCMEAKMLKSKSIMKDKK